MADDSDRGERTLRDQLAALRGLLVLSMLMTSQGDEGQILHIATSAVSSLGPARAEGLQVDGRVTLAGLGGADRQAAVEGGVAILGNGGSPLALPWAAWAWAYPLSSPGGAAGHLIVSAGVEPEEHQKFLLRVLAQQTGVAVANARLHAGERERTAEVKRANVAIARSAEALRRKTEIHGRLTEVAAAGEGEDGIARAVHELTGLSVVVEDVHGNVRAWAGPLINQVRKEGPRQRARTIERALDQREVRDRGRVLAVAGHREDVLGVLALVDPDGVAGEQELVALEHGATVLGMTLAGVRRTVESELRQRRDLVDELLNGADEERVSNRARTLGYDLSRPHRVVVVQAVASLLDEDEFFHAVRRAARDVPVGSLLAPRADGVVVLCDADQPWERFRRAVVAQVQGSRCRVGVGGHCELLPEYARSHREAKLALRIQQRSGGADRATAYDDLGVYQVLAEVEDPEAVDRFVRKWLGAILDYDEARGADLVVTVSTYLEHGGHYDSTAEALGVHRNTLKYRLQRVREVSGLDLGDADTRFNLELASRARRTLLALRDG